MQAEPLDAEDHRLSALRRYGILDTSREADFDAVVKVGPALCGTPIAVVKLIESPAVVQAG